MLALPHKPERRSWTIRKPLMIGLSALLILFGLVTLWATTFDIAGAVIGQGQVQATSNRIAVQHPVGGIVAEILAANGDKVRAGQVVMRLDRSSLSSELAAVEGELFELLANEARLDAEFSGRRTLIPHPLLRSAATTNPAAKSLLNQQQLQLDAHFRLLDTEILLLNKQAGQTSEEARGVQAALAAKRDEVGLLTEELTRSLDFLRKGYTTKNVVTDIQREVIKVKGEIGSLTAKLAELRGKVSEQHLKTFATPMSIKEISADKLNLSKQQSTKLIENRNSIVHRIGMSEVRSPVEGIVFDSKILGPRSVIEAAKPIMYIVPNGKLDLVVVRVEATDIDQVHLGQDVGLRFTTYDRRSTPIIDGRVTAVSADAFLDEKTKAYYYFVDVKLMNTEVAKLGPVDLVPGMPVEAFIRTESRTPASYVTKPISDFFAKAFRD